MIASAAEWLPGVTIRDQTPPGQPGLPRLDVAAFVGFTERGPLDRATVVEDPAEFERRFGGSPALVDHKGLRFKPLLPGAVGAFFENGGRRCWIVRVAGPDAGVAAFGVPGLFRADRGWDGSGTKQPEARLRLRASSPGRWANGLCLACRLVAVARERAGVEWLGASGAFRIQGSERWLVGDLLRVVGVGEMPRLFAVDEIRDEPSGEGGEGEEEEELARPQLARGRFVGGAPPPEAFAGGVSRVEALTFDVLVDAGRAGEEALTGLGFHPLHARYALNAVKAESLFLAPPAAEPGTGGLTASDPLLFPHRMPVRITGRRRVGVELPGQDDFEDFSAELYAPRELDALAPATLQALAAQAQEEAHRSAQGGYVPDPVGLRGMLALLPLTEVAMLAVPDVLWPPGAEEGPDPGDELPGAGPPSLPEPEPGFGPCHAVPPPPDAPRQVTASPTADGVRIRWTPVPGPVSYRVERALAGSGDDFVPLASGLTQPEWLDPTVPEQRRPEYRVVAVGPGGASAPGGPAVPLRAAGAARLDGFAEADAVEVQRAAIRFCALRGDLVAVLGVPRGRSPLEWRRRLARRAGGDSYGALYHPWIRVRTGDGVVVVPLPPDGAACGVIARRERARGAWVAPANETVRGALGLEEAIGEAAWAELLEAGVNVLRPRPGGLRILSARTLSRDRSLSQLGIRRLLILLKKALLLWGMDFVFESHDRNLREALRHRVETSLEHLFRRGAFAGGAPEESYQVVVDDTVNPPPSVDAGRIVALVKVAPSWPMEFLEVRLVQASDGLLQFVEG